MSDAVIHIPTSAFAYEMALSGLTRLDEQLLRAGSYPNNYDAGVRYQREAGDVWRHVDEVNRSKWGDCEDLAAWRAAELRVSGEDPDAFVYVYKSGPHMFHAVVGRGDGRIEDPSIKLGMKVSTARRKIMPKFVGEGYGTSGVEEFYQRDKPQIWDHSNGRRDFEIGAQEDQRADAPGYEGDDAEDVDDTIRDENRDQDDDQRDDDTGAPLKANASEVKRPILRRPPAKGGKRGKRGGRFKRFAKRGLKIAVSPQLAQARLAKAAFSTLWGDGAPSCCGAIGPDPTPDRSTITFDIYQTGKGYSGVLRLPIGADKAMLLSTSPSPTKARAATKAQNMAKAVNHPVVKALMPPQARLALNALQSAPAAKALKVLSRFGR